MGFRSIRRWLNEAFFRRQPMAWGAYICVQDDALFSPEFAKEASIMFEADMHRKVAHAWRTRNQALARDTFKIIVKYPAAHLDLLRFCPAPPNLATCGWKLYTDPYPWRRRKAALEKSLREVNRINVKQAIEKTLLVVMKSKA